MEREFLKSLAETRAMEATLTSKIRAAEGTEPSDNSSTRRGASDQQKHVQELADRFGRVRSQLATERTRFSALHNGWKVRQCVLHKLGNEPVAVSPGDVPELPSPHMSHFMSCATKVQAPLAPGSACIQIDSVLATCRMTGRRLRRCSSSLASVTSWMRMRPCMPARIWIRP